MRRVLAVILVVVVTSMLSACELLGIQHERTVPKGDAWRNEVIVAIEETDGVLFSSVTVHDVDSGGGYEGPLVEGSLMVDGDAQAVVDEALRRISDVLGPETNGVHIQIAVSVCDGPAQKLREFGYEGVGNGAALWEATH